MIDESKQAVSGVRPCCEGGEKRGWEGGVWSVEEGRRVGRWEGERERKVYF